MDCQKSSGQSYRHSFHSGKVPTLGRDGALFVVFFPNFKEPIQVVADPKATNWSSITFTKEIQKVCLRGISTSQSLYSYIGGGLSVFGCHLVFKP